MLIQVEENIGRTSNITALLALRGRFQHHKEHRLYLISSSIFPSVLLFFLFVWSSTRPRAFRLHREEFSPTSDGVFRLEVKSGATAFPSSLIGWEVPTRRAAAKNDWLFVSNLSVKDETGTIGWESHSSVTFRAPPHVPSHAPVAAFTKEPRLRSMNLGVIATAVLEGSGFGFTLKCDGDTEFPGYSSWHNNLLRCCWIRTQGCPGGGVRVNCKCSLIGALCSVLFSPRETWAHMIFLKCWSDYDFICFVFPRTNRALVRHQNMFYCVFRDLSGHLSSFISR